MPSPPCSPQIATPRRSTSSVGRGRVLDDASGLVLASLAADRGHVYHPASRPGAGESPKLPMLYGFLMGAAFGIGGTAFNVAIRYIGFSLTYSIAIGLSGVLGTFVTPLVEGTLGETLQKPGAGWVMAGVAVGSARHRPVRRRRAIQGTATCEQQKGGRGRILLDQRVAVPCSPASFRPARNRHQRRVEADRRCRQPVPCRTVARQHRSAIRQSQPSHRPDLYLVSCPKEPNARRVDPARQGHRTAQPSRSTICSPSLSVDFGTGNSSSTIWAAYGWAKPTSSRVGRC